MLNALASAHLGPSKGATGPYDSFYQGLGITWSDTPGRMVVRATEDSAPARVLDAGCGDGKNSLYLARLGSEVTAFDISASAIAAFNLRRSQSLGTQTINLFQANVINLKVPSGSFDLVVAYGLYHCLENKDLLLGHEALTAALKPGGMFAFAAFNDELPLPLDHQTPGLILRPSDHILFLLEGWGVDALEIGTITENHLPLVGQHSHSLTWGLFRKPRS
jgi:SAM-dependent methyltransferase